MGMAPTMGMAPIEQRQPLARDVIPGHLFACRCFCGTRDYNPMGGALGGTVGGMVSGMVGGVVGGAVGDMLGGAVGGMVGDGAPRYSQDSASYKYVFNPEPIYTASVQGFGQVVRNPKIMRTVRDPVTGRLREFFSVVAATRSADLSVTEARLFKSYLDGNPPQGRLILTLISELLQRSTAALREPEPVTGEGVTPAPSVLNPAAAARGVEALARSIAEIAALGAAAERDEKGREGEGRGGIRGRRISPAQQILSGDFSLALAQESAPSSGSKAGAKVLPTSTSQVRFVPVTAEMLKTPFAARAQCVKLCRDEVLATPAVARRFGSHLDFAVLKRSDMAPVGEHVTPERFEWGLPYVEIPAVQNLPRDPQWEAKMKLRFEKPYHLAANFDPKTGFTKAVVLPDGKSSVQPDGLCSLLYNSLNDFGTHAGTSPVQIPGVPPQDVMLEYRDLDLSDWYRPHDLNPSRSIAKIRHLPYHASPLDPPPVAQQHSHSQPQTIRQYPETLPTSSQEIDEDLAEDLTD
ncbi:hypothetical protein GNI_054960 [Gregarina niphandrodes]|uniref:Uncharacterized protein n=1 Tax=Gregarina niphandrodes TaxID=110365 RepID=A0A023B8Z5_GRENI|nr:hypothetical protein GNI_054960 [Gregarina niphandrodes]EZG70667.1 hypothetical protein GNI_054960 [Gregarina niphandrodes]|eukprot:XP_011129908.1 hypothetical protein GNI_054960 [Gregarina niphandrodes]